MVNKIFSCRVRAPIPPVWTRTIDWMNLSTLIGDCVQNSFPFHSLFFCHLYWSSWYNTTRETRHIDKRNNANYQASNVDPIFSQVHTDMSEEREQTVLCKSVDPCECVFPPSPLRLELRLDSKLSSRGGGNSEGCSKGNLFDLHFFRKSCLLFLII